MERRGIGRPATYAAIIENIISRTYVKEEKGFLVPTPRGNSWWTPWWAHSAF
jgi:DNA topoisomerase-1